MNSTVESPKSSQVKNAKLELERLQSQVNVLKLQLATQRQELNQVEAGSDRFLAIASQISEIHAAINNLGVAESGNESVKTADSALPPKSPNSGGL